MVVEVIFDNIAGMFGAIVLLKNSISIREEVCKARSHVMDQYLMLHFTINVAYDRMQMAYIMGSKRSPHHYCAIVLQSAL